MLSYPETFEVKGIFSVVPVQQLDSQSRFDVCVDHVGHWALSSGHLAPVLTDFPVSEVIVVQGSEGEGPAPLKSLCA